MTRNSLRIGGKPVETGGIYIGPDIAEALLTPSDRSENFQVVVIGSGLGGYLAHRLAAEGISVAVLESGGIPKSASNSQLLIEQHRTLYNCLKEVRFSRTSLNCEFQGGEARVLGGHLNYWGGFTPLPTPLDLLSFSPQIRDQFRSGAGIAETRELLGVSNVGTAYQRNVVGPLMARTMPGWIHKDGSFAVQREPVRCIDPPTGMSTPANLLVQDALLKKHDLSVFLWTEVKEIRPVNADWVDVFTKNAHTNEERIFRASVLVLAGGSIGSPEILLKSGLGKLNTQIGWNITDHSIFYTRFAIPPTSPFFRKGTTAKLYSFDPTAEPDANACLLSIEIGTGFHQKRWNHTNVLKSIDYMKRNSFVSEIVFLRHEPLVPTNRVYVDARSGALGLDLDMTQVSHAELSRMNDIKDEVIRSLGGEPLENQTLELRRASMGEVAHQVGSLSMAHGVVDHNLKLCGYENIYVSDNSVFPVATAANPTFTMAWLGLAVVLRIASRLTWHEIRV